MAIQESLVGLVFFFDAIFLQVSDTFFFVSNLHDTFWKFAWKQHQNDIHQKIAQFAKTPPQENNLLMSFWCRFHRFRAGFWHVPVRGLHESNITKNLRRKRNNEDNIFVEVVFMQVSASFRQVSGRFLTCFFLSATCRKTAGTSGKPAENEITNNCSTYSTMSIKAAFLVMSFSCRFPAGFWHVPFHQYQ